VPAPSAHLSPYARHVRRMRRLALGQALSDARYAAGMTQTELAEASGVSRPTISRLEQGDSSISSDRIWDLAFAVGVEPAELFVAASALLDADEVADHDPGSDPDH